MRSHTIRFAFRHSGLHAADKLHKRKIPDL